MDEYLANAALPLGISIGLMFRRGPFESGSDVY